MDEALTILERFPDHWKAWALVGVGVLLAVEAIATAFPMSGPAKRRLALVLGPLAGLGLYATGQIDVPLHGEFAPASDVGDELRHLFGCGFFGLLGTLASIAAHDLGGGEMLKAAAIKFLGRSSTPAAPAGAP